VRGRTGAYLEVAEGHPSASLPKMAREGLLVDLHAAINKAKKTNAPVRAEGVHVKSNGHTTEVNLTVTPIRPDGATGRFFMVVFQDAAQKHTAAAKRRTPPETLRGALGREVERLRHENADVKQQLRTLLEDNETTTEEFKSANEEVLSANEELQSTNEELQTSKEELESANEELHTVNEEMQHRNELLTQLNNDLTNLLNSVNLPMVMVGADLSVRRFTPQATTMLGLMAGDVGRPIPRLKLKIDVSNLEQMMLDVIQEVQAKQSEVQDQEGNWCSLRITPYRTLDNRIDGVVLSVLDGTALGESSRTKTEKDGHKSSAKKSVSRGNARLKKK